MLVGLAAAIAGYAVSSNQPPTFAASGSVLVSDPRGSAIITDPFTAYIDRGRYVRNEAEVFKSRPVAEGASALLGGDPSADEIQRVVTAQGEYEFDVLTIGATQPNGQGAIDVVNAVVASYEDVVAAETQSSAETATQSLLNSKLELQVRIAETDTALAEHPDSVTLAAQRDAQLAQLSALDAQVEQIAVSSALYGSGVRLYDAPRGAARIAPKPARTAAIALLFGLTAAGAWAWWREERRDQVESRQTPAAVLDAPLLGSVPKFSTVKVSGPAPTVTAPDSAASEAYHFIVSSLDLALAHVNGSTVLVTSTGAGDGKTVTALNLAVAAAGNGRRPLLVDADVRTHGLTRISGLDSVPGLTNVAGETGTVTDLIRPWGVGPKTDLRFVPAGNTETPDPARFFRSPGFQNAMPLLTADQVLSIIDAPPVLEVPETTDIARHVDAVLLVVGAGTSVKKLDEARERISMTGKPIVGYVYNRTAEGFRKYGYGYGYGSGSG